MNQLSAGLAQYNYMRAQLEEMFPDVDEETLLDTLEGLNSHFKCNTGMLRSCDGKTI